MRNIGVLTTSRSEYSILRPVLKAITDDVDLNLQLFVGGAHLAPEFGHTVEQIEFPITEQLECLLSSDTPEGIAKSIGITTFSFAQAFSNTRPDILLITGDRYEAIAVALAAVPFKIPVAHLGGGDVTIGAFDESLRHAITKLSHLHFCYAYSQACRIVQMGENPTKVWITGNPALDKIHEIADSVPVVEDALVVIFHPVTLEYERTDEYINNLLAALAARSEPIVFIFPNADTSGRHIVKKLRKLSGATVYANLVPGIFYNLLRHAKAIVGNSSCALMEAPSFELPAVNIGSRQEGRLRGENIIDVGTSIEEISKGIELAVSPEFRTKLNGMKNPYGTGHATPKIISILKSTSLDIIEKRFYEN
jgi:UDP-hydrolysing UDP-N-acetyl-D-glucosamine 2-epimerase